MDARFIDVDGIKKPTEEDIASEDQIVGEMRPFYSDEDERKVIRKIDRQYVLDWRCFVNRHIAN